MYICHFYLSVSQSSHFLYQYSAIITFKSTNTQYSTTTASKSTKVKYNMSSTILAIYGVTYAILTNHFIIIFNLFYLYSTPLNLIILMGYHLLSVFSLSLTPPYFCIIFLYCYLFFLDFFSLFSYSFNLFYTSLCCLFLQNVTRYLIYCRLLSLYSLVLLLGDKPSNPIYHIISLTISSGLITSLTLHSYEDFLQ